MYTFRNNSNDADRDKTTVPLITGIVQHMFMPFSSLFRAGKSSDGMDKARRLTTELAQDIAVLRKRIFVAKVPPKVTTPTASGEEETEETLTPSKVQGMIYHLKHTKNSIASKEIYKNN